MSYSISSVKELMGIRDRVERELAALQLENVSGALVDQEGFPRPDVDVHSLANTRQRIACLQNDHLAIMKQIESQLLELHKQAKQSNANNTANSDSEKQAADKDNGPTSYSTVVARPGCAPSARRQAQLTSDSDSDSGSGGQSLADLEALHPFYVVRTVMDGSPAQQAGLLAGDLVLQFGSIRKDNVSTSSMQRAVSHSIGRPLCLVVSRQQSHVPATATATPAIIQLSLVPQQWAGPGLVGCHFVDL